jgi:hypothetical protein
LQGNEFVFEKLRIEHEGEGVKNYRFRHGEGEETEETVLGPTQMRRYAVGAWLDKLKAEIDVCCTPPHNLPAHPTICPCMMHGLLLTAPGLRLAVVGQH